MRPDQWRAPTSPEEVARRAGGRRRYNAVRQFRADLRQLEVLARLERYGLHHGVQARIGRDLGVSARTVGRDVGAILLRGYRPCPRCDALVPRERWEQAGLLDGP